MNLADKIAADVQTVFLRANHFAEQVTYFSGIVGQVTITALKVERMDGPADQQHARSITRRATFGFGDQAGTGIEQLTDSDVIVDAAGTRWAITNGGVESTREGGMWTVAFESASLVNQGTRTHRTF